MTRDAEPSDESASEHDPGYSREPSARKGTFGGECEPLSELDPEFGGFNVDEISVDVGTPACDSGTCVIQGFQGRVSCPYGQSGPFDCVVPGTNEPVRVAVQPQLVSRPPSVGALCSCQCAGPGPGPYCSCPNHLQCTHLIDDLGFGDRAIAGSYCLPKAAVYVKGSPFWEECDRQRQNCEP